MVGFGPFAKGDSLLTSSGLMDEPPYFLGRELVWLSIGWHVGDPYRQRPAQTGCNC